MKESKMKFPEALKKLLGRGYVSFPELLVGLARENALSEFTPLQYMIQALAPSGYQRAIMMADSLADMDRMAVEFARLTGFCEDAAAYLFRSFAYAQGLLTEVPQVPSLDKREAKPSTDVGEVAEQAVEYAEKSVKEAAPQWNPQWSEEEKTRYLSSLISVNRDNERRLGVKVNNPACIAAGLYEFRLSAELQRDEPGATGALFYAVYDKDSVVIDSGALGVLCYDDVSPLPRVAVVPIAPARVSKIYFYWD
jgi:hypothetical protein